MRGVPAGTAASAGRRYGAVVAFSGHLTDPPDRSTPRFPPQREGWVRERIAAVLDDWGIGPRDLAICGGARGGDIIFAECCLDRGVDVRLYVPLPLDEFLAHSVQGASEEWEHRFRGLLDRCEVVPFDPPPGAWLDPGRVFERVNIRMLEAARAAASPTEPSAILVWDRRSTGDGAGGTSDFAARVIGRGGRVAIIDPTAPLGE